jgi:membrane protein DedA with SNARE-associated domain
MAIFSLVFLQEIGVPNPVPNELVLLFSGYLASIGQLNFTAVLLTVITADTIGSSVLYMAFYYCGQRILQKWPHVIPTSKLAYLTARVSHKDHWSIYIGRHLPFLRGYTAVAAGLLKVSPTIFLPAVLLSALTWSGGYVTAGKLLGQEYVKLVSKLAIGKLILVGLAVLCTIGFAGLRLCYWLKNKKIHTSVWFFTRGERSNNPE